jgi:hypothetical protein
MVGGKLLLMVHVSTWPHLRVSLVLLHGALLLMLLHVVLLFGGWMMFFISGQRAPVCGSTCAVVGGIVGDVAAAGACVWSDVIAIDGVRRAVTCGVNASGGGVVVVAAVNSGGATVGFLELPELIGGRLLLHLLAGIELLLVGRLVVLMFVM